jgi:hypothetical protein
MTKEKNNWLPNDHFFVDNNGKMAEAKQTVQSFVKKHQTAFSNKIITSLDFTTQELETLNIKNDHLQGFGEQQIPFILPNGTIPVVCNVAAYAHCPKHAHDDLIGFWFIASGKIIVNNTTVLRAKDWFITDAGANYELHTEAEGCVMFHGYSPNHKLKN